MRLFEPAWALLEDGLAVTLRDSLLRGYWTDYMASERRGQPHTKHLQASQLPASLQVCILSGVRIIAELWTVASDMLGLGSLTAARSPSCGPAKCSSSGQEHGAAASGAH